MKIRGFRAKIVVPLALLGAVGCTIVTNPKPTTQPATAQPASTPAPQPQPTVTPPPATTTPPVATAAPPVVTPTPSATTPPPAATDTRTPPRPRLRLPGVSYQAPVMSGPNIFGSPTKTDGALEGALYYLPDGTSSFPADFLKNRVETRFYVTELNIQPQRFNGDFPGLPNRTQFFAIRYSGQFSVAASGSYEFRIVSDDGSKLTIDNVALINNDGVHGPLSASQTINLANGVHSIIVDYFQGPRWRVALQLFVTGPDGKEKIWTTKI